jgi:peptidyl-tRNA hydrolase
LIKWLTQPIKEAVVVSVVEEDSVVATEPKVKDVGLVVAVVEETGVTEEVVDVVTVVHLVVAEARTRRVPGFRLPNLVAWSRKVT